MDAAVPALAGAGLTPAAAMKRLLQGPPAAPAPPTRAVGGDDLKDAALGFEAIFMRQLLRDLRKTTSINGESSYSAGFYNDMFDDYLAEHLARAGGLGLADVIRTYVERGGQ